MNQLQLNGTAALRRVFVIAGLLCWCNSGAAQSSLTNGGAETGDMSSWSSTHVAAVQEQGQTTGTVLPHEGDWFFTMAAVPGSSASMWQTNTLPSGVSQLLLSGMVQTENLTGDDYGVAVLSVLDSAGHTVAAMTNGPLATASFDWVPFDLQLDVPRSASSWRVDLQGIRVYGSYVNVFYDDLLLDSAGPAIRITNIWCAASGHVALAWTSAGTGFVYTVEATTSLTDTVFTPVLPTNQWPIPHTTWTNLNQQNEAEFFRVKGMD